MAWYPWHKPRLEDIFHEPNENVQRQKKFFDYEDSFVTTKMLQTIKIDMKNLEHAKVFKFLIGCQYTPTYLDHFKYSGKEP